MVQENYYNTVNTRGKFFPFYLRYVLSIACLIAGGNWNNGTNCGSRCRNSNNVRSNVNTNIGGRRSIWFWQKRTPRLRVNSSRGHIFGGMPENEDGGLERLVACRISFQLFYKE